MRKSIIAACDEAFLIGIDGRLPWHLPADMRLFRRLTTGKPVVMGRLTYESLGKPLPGRTNIVLSSRRGLVIPGAVVVHDLDMAFVRAAATGAEECMVIGGGEVYSQAIDVVDRLYLSVIRATYEVPRGAHPVYFPKHRWHEARRHGEVVEHHLAEGDAPAWSFYTIDFAPAVHRALVRPIGGRTSTFPPPLPAACASPAPA